MKTILVVAPHLPWPPTTGGNIRMVNTAVALHREHSLHLLCYWSAGQGPGAESPLRPYFRSIEALKGTRETLLDDPAAPPAIDHHFSTAMRDALARKLQELQPALVQFEFWFMGQYLALVPELQKTRTAIIAHDLEYVTRRQLAPAETDAPWEKYREYELQYYRAAGRVLTVTDRDRDKLLAEGLDPARVRVTPTGLQAEFQHAAPKRQELVFVGAFDHYPNEEGVRWFVREIWPGLQARFRDLRFTVVGRAPTPAIRALHDPAAGIEVTGTVDSVAPYLNRALVSVAPLRLGSGIKGKICEALGYGLPVVTTPLGAEGLAGVPGIAVAPDAPAFQAAVARLLDDERARAAAGKAGRLHFSQHWSMAALARNLQGLYAELLA